MISEQGIDVTLHHVAVKSQSPNAILVPRVSGLYTIHLPSNSRGMRVLNLSQLQVCLDRVNGNLRALSISQKWPAGTASPKMQMPMQTSNWGLFLAKLAALFKNEQFSRTGPAGYFWPMKRTQRQTLDNVNRGYQLIVLEGQCHTILSGSPVRIKFWEWKRTETWNDWPTFSSLDVMYSKNPQSLQWIVLDGKFHLMFFFDL